MAGKTGHLVSDADICPYLAAADVMITDHSSAGFEYLLLDRPLVRIHVPELLRSSNIGEEYVRLLADAARSVEGPLDALDAVEQGLADPAAGSHVAPRRRRGSLLSVQAGPRHGRWTSCMTPWSCPPLPRRLRWAAAPR